MFACYLSRLNLLLVAATGGGMGWSQSGREEAILHPCVCTSAGPGVMSARFSSRNYGEKWTESGPRD